jgi:hypothetical protein
MLCGSGNNCSILKKMGKHLNLFCVLVLVLRSMLANAQKLANSLLIEANNDLVVNHRSWRRPATQRDHFFHGSNFLADIFVGEHNSVLR